MNERKIGILLSYLNIALHAIVGFLYVPILLHYIGKSEYGLYQLIGSLIAYFSIMDFGLTAAVTRFYTKYKALKDKVGMENILAISLYGYGDGSGYPVLYQVQGAEGQGGNGEHPGHFSVWVWGSHSAFAVGGEYLLLESGWDFRGQYDGGGVTGSSADVPAAAVQHCGEPFHHGVPVGDQCP